MQKKSSFQIFPDTIFVLLLLLLFLLLFTVIKERIYMFNSVNKSASYRDNNFSQESVVCWMNLISENQSKRISLAE